ncbi:phosphoglycolate phosphatase 1A, chloroplastic-like, partial [Curcuma longa]|uniref:phosphoglycolate phosphatase 1A, chloroplastic-like n=1 Tax=Curcuma longa TaxID=136217 RepID=UPI003D9EB9D5
MLVTRGTAAVSAFVSSRFPVAPTVVTQQRLFSTLPLPCSFRHFGVRRRFGRRGSTMDSGSVIRAAAQRLQNVDDLIDSVQTFILDCDGVVWKGDKLIEGVPETLDMLRSKGKRLVFVTNNSTKSRKQYGKKFETLGLSVSEEEIFASSFAAAAYLKSIDFPRDKKVYVIGEDGIIKELELAGFQYLGGP